MDECKPLKIILMMRPPVCWYPGARGVLCAPFSVGWTLTAHFALHKPTDTKDQLNSLSRWSWALLLGASLPSGVRDGNELPALCSKTGQGWVQVKARRSLHIEPSPAQKISTELCLMVNLLPSFCLQKGHYFPTVFVKQDSYFSPEKNQLLNVLYVYQFISHL